MHKFKSNNLIGTHTKTICENKEREQVKNIYHMVYELDLVLILYFKLI